jgi:CxxC-x17-CxxC domain-containing protein
MAFQNQDDSRPSQKFQGNWVCSKCKTPITELPFKPSDDRLDQLLCRDCYRAKRQSYSR